MAPLRRPEACFLLPKSHAVTLALVVEMAVMAIPATIPPAPKDAFRTIIPALSRKPVALKDTHLSCPSCSVGEMSHCFAARLPFSDESQVSKIMYSLAYDLPPITYQMSTTLVSHTLEHLNFLSSVIHPLPFI